jgi:hypothetical protein
VFPVRYELDSYILFKRNSVFKWLNKLRIYMNFCDPQLVSTVRYNGAI